MVLAISQHQKYHNNLCPYKILHNHFFFSPGTYNGLKRKWKQCLWKILEGQTKSIIAFVILTNFKTKRAVSSVVSEVNFSLYLSRRLTASKLPLYPFQSLMQARKISLERSRK